MLGRLGSRRCRVYWLWSLFVHCGVCLVLFGNYVGCIGSILCPPYSCLLLPFSSKQKSKSAALQLFLLSSLRSARDKHTVHVVWCIFFHISPLHILLRENHYLDPEDIQCELKRLHTKGDFSSGNPQPNSCVPNIYLSFPISWNRQGLHSQTYYLRSSCVLPVHSLFPLVLFVSSSHRITICSRCEVNICFYFYPSLSLTPINVLRLLIKPFILLHPSWKETPHWVFLCAVFSSPHLL